MHVHQKLRELKYINKILKSYFINLYRFLENFISGISFIILKNIIHGFGDMILRFSLRFARNKMFYYICETTSNF